MSKKKQNIFLLLIMISIVLYFLNRRNPDQEQSDLDQQKLAKIKSTAKSDTSVEPKKIEQSIAAIENHDNGPKDLPKTDSAKKITAFQPKEIVMASQPQERNAKAAKFKLEDGLVTIAGDIVLGVPKTSDFPNQGWIEIPEFSIWESAEIPFHIQPGLANPERIYQAFELFKDSPIHFVALTEQSDAIVFEEKAGTCKSYVGKVGGMQPIWLGSDCSPVDIAHEIMHALGFIHEQNRTDRDNFIEIIWDNIKEDYKYNFEMLPDSYMKVSGATNFDFYSLMIYPASSFAKKNSLITIKTKQSQQIKPGMGLSHSDLERLQKFYGQ